MRSTTATLPALLCALALAAFAPAGSSADVERRLEFDVYLDGERIGHHHFVLRRSDGVQVVDSSADFTVKALFVTLFSYQHRNREVWRDGCLQTIDARTDSNGDEYLVKGHSTGGGFMVRTAASNGRLERCVRTFAYWDRSLLGHARLLNAQTGEQVAVTLRPLGSASMSLDGEPVPVERYALTGDGVDIVLAYAAGSGEWVSLESRLESGRILQYRRHQPGSGTVSSPRSRSSGGRV